MKQRMQGLVAGIVIGAVGASGIVYAQSITKNIEVTYDNIKVYKDNVLCETKDSSGNTVEPFIYEGTTYMPVRGTAQLADMRVTWDGATKSVYLWDELSEDGNLYALDVCPPYETDYYKAYMTNDGKSFSMANEKYANGFTIGDDWSNRYGYAYFNLNGKYSSMEFTLGHVDGTSMMNKDFQFFVDDRLVYECSIKASDLPKKISVPLNYGLQLKVESRSGGLCGFGNVILKQ